MKKIFVLPIAFFALAAALAQHRAKSAAVGAFGSSGHSQQAEDEGTAARIARIENDLSPAVVIKGQAHRAMTLRARMHFYNAWCVKVPSGLGFLSSSPSSRLQHCFAS